MRRLLSAVATIAAIAIVVPLGASTRAHAQEEDEPATAAPWSYRAGDVDCDGLYAVPKGAAAKGPAVLVVHDWMGVSPFVAGRLETLAKMGYAAFGADVYGRGARPKDQAEAGALAGRYKGDRPLFRARLTAALGAMGAHPLVDPKRVVVIGYCFGGTGALELGRSGADLRGIVSFHGGLASPTPADAKRIQGKVLVLHGADDPMVPPAEVAGFEAEMRDAKLDWQLVKYGGAVHAFTNPAAGNDPSKGAAYQADADRRSWAAATAFFAETLGPR